MPLDIVIFGVIAVILIFRFLGVLGQNDKDDGRPRRDAFGNYRKSVDEQRARRAEKRTGRQVGRQQQQVERRTEKSAEEDAMTKSAVAQHPDARNEPTTEPAATPAVTLGDKAFLEGAKAAFAMILEAYATSDREKLKVLLDKEMFARMSDEIDKRQNAEERLEISLLEIVDAQISKRKQDEHYEQIAVTFTSKQCHLFFNKDNKLIDGDPDEEELLCDRWTFRQDLASSDPTWFLCATRSQAVTKKSLNKSLNKPLSKPLPRKASAKKALPKSKSPKAL